MEKRTNEEIIKEIEELMNELELITEDRGTINSYAFTIHNGKTDVFKQVISSGNYLRFGASRLKWDVQLKLPKGSD